MNNLLVGVLAAAIAIVAIIALTLFAIKRINFMNSENIYAIRELYRKRNNG